MVLTLNINSFSAEILIENTCKIYSYYIFSVVTLFHEHWMSFSFTKIGYDQVVDFAKPLDV